MPVVNSNPGSSRLEGGNTLLVLGALLLVFELIVMNWIGWDIRAGNYFMQIVMAVVAVVAVVLLLWGLACRRRHSA
jgi:apolipoprotein N-acyltransferase